MLVVRAGASRLVLVGCPACPQDDEFFGTGKTADGGLAKNEFKDNAFWQQNPIMDFGDDPVLAAMSKSKAPAS